ncbi:hypothetical protein NIES2119_17360 [[Phormidium ambiguum] IAM M-71]|uniref:Uncharacterized protein n=1 Tax=[Phormidium ambiguum] IAM M-71 TaxID=454136 RepID=A0A1U7IHA4_9CYAN|nr:hypothetical protein NIES2119_17360 [Phormidium ambiguum IAM M-71]
MKIGFAPKFFFPHEGLVLSLRKAIVAYNDIDKMKIFGKSHHHLIRITFCCSVRYLSLMYTNLAIVKRAEKIMMDFYKRDDFSRI